MPQLDRDVYLRNHVMGVLVSYSGKGLTHSNMGELADSITEAVIEGDRAWQEENLFEQMRDMGMGEDDVPQ